MPGNLDLEKLKKIMMLTTSTADGEALNAIRMANRMLDKAGIRWDGYLGAPAGARAEEKVNTGGSREYGSRGGAGPRYDPFRQKSGGQAWYDDWDTNWFSDTLKRQARERREREEREKKAREEAEIDAGTVPSELMLHVCLEKVKGPSRTFIESLDYHFRTRGYLSEKQRAALYKFYRNVMDPPHRR